jgi:ergothioneine biosynthesis protein EgtB
VTAPGSTVLAAGFADVRASTEALAAPLSAEDQTVSTMPDVSPTKWHRAHTTWFFEQFVLLQSARGYEPVDGRYLYLFNSYYEGAGPRHPRAERGYLTRPGIAEVAAYRHRVDEAVQALLASPGGDDPDLLGTVQLGLHHEQQHQELLLMDIKHVLGTNPFRPAYMPVPAPATTAPPVSWCGLEGGLVEVGAAGGFSFDNELPRHRQWLEPFEIADRLVTAGEWMAFMDDGGYERPELWLSDGWATVRAEGRRAPLYWDLAPDGAGWLLHTLGGHRRVDPGEPVVHVSYHEADAFAHWSGARLPTEAEWEHAAGLLAAGTSDRRPSPAATLHPVTSPDGGWFGQVWQWTASAYLAYPGFRPAPGVVGEYNGKFMSGQHVLRGSACTTPPGHARASYRNFFPPATRWAFSGVRLAR